MGEQQHQLTNQPGRVCFIGDSLTEFWLHTGKPVWDREFAPLKCWNLGLAADRTEHVLHRIRWLDFGRARPEAVVLLMGTNNLGMTPPDSPESVARAIRKGVDLLQKKLPGAHILVLGLPPSGMEPHSPLRMNLRATNDLLAATAWPVGTTYVPLYESLVDPQDQWRPAYTLDGTHFSLAGYEAVAAQIGPALRQRIKPSSNKP
jgi:lysophospholipase L1-like esterase